MAISRMQEPRQLYGLGSLVKSIGKGVKKFVKSPLGKAAILGIGAFGLPGGALGMKGFLSPGIKSAVGATLFGTPGVPDAVGKEGIFSNFFSKLGTGGKLGIGTSIATYLLSQGKSKEEVEAITQDKDALSAYLAQYYRATNQDASDTEVQEFVDVNTREYDATGGRVGFSNGSGEVSGTFGVLSENADISKIIDQKVTDYENEYMKKTGELPPEFYGDKYRMQLQKEYLMEKKANGGRIGFDKGGYTFKQFLQDKSNVDKFMNQEQLKKMYENMMKQREVAEQKQMAANGGRIGLKDGPKKYMFNDVLREPKSDLERASVGNPGTKEMYKSEILKMLAENRDEAKTKIPMKQKPFKPDLEKIKKLIEKKKKGLAAGGMPTGIMRTNQAGVMERDYRDEGGFVPVGIKERADDVPAMLSKNEFVMTADAVRGAGNGSIEKGAQRMYDQMKNLESKVA